MSHLFEIGTTCESIDDVQEARVLIDGENYYAVLCEALRKARKYVCMTGWQFDTRANLAPGADGSRLEFLQFLNELCTANPDLQIFITAWNYSVVYAIEREWFQNVRFALSAHERVHFRFLNHPEAGAAHHEKIVVVDGRWGFTGGLDVCDERWDSRSHKPSDGRRINAHGDQYGPFHDVQMFLAGGAVGTLEDFFWQSWVQAGGSQEDRPQKTVNLSFSPDDLSALHERGLPLRCPRVALSRTRVEDNNFHVEELLRRAVDQAEHAIYIENQYFTSKAFVKALIARMCNGKLPKLHIVLVLPEGGHSKKEELVLGGRQRIMLWLVRKLAESNGHHVRVLKSCSRTEEGETVATYIHSKVMTVDDRFVSIGSANLMNRSMRVDHELNASFSAELCETEEQKAALGCDIRHLRASLLAEHAGAAEIDPQLSVRETLALVDRWCNDPNSKLELQELEPPQEDDPFFSMVCDPAAPLDWTNLQKCVDALFDSDQTIVKGAARRVGQRLGVVDIGEEKKSAVGSGP